MSVKHSPVVVRLSSPSLPLCSACCWPPLVLAVAGAGGGRWLVCIYPDCYKHFLVMLTHRLPKCKNKHKPRSQVQRASNLIKQNKLKYNDASFEVDKYIQIYSLLTDNNHAMLGTTKLSPFYHFPSSHSGPDATKM